MLLTVLAAAVAGILPGIRGTRDLRPGLQRTSAGGGGFRFGRVWTVALVLQIAVSMIFPLVTLAVGSEGGREQGMYHLAAAGEIHPVRAAIARAFGPTLRGIAMEVGPALTLHNVTTLVELTHGSGSSTPSGPPSSAS